MIPIKGRVRACLELLRNQNLKDKIVVDIGSSTGWLEKEVIKDVQSIIGVEPNLYALRQAQKKVPKAKFLNGDATKIALPNSSVDIVTLFDVIEHVPKRNEEIVLKEAHRILKSDGKLLVSTPNSHLLLNLADPAWYFGHRHYKISEIENLCHRVGFKVKNLEIKGSWWSMLYIIWFYLVKFFLKDKSPRNKFLEDKDDYGYSRKGVFNIFCVAQK